VTVIQLRAAPLPEEVSMDQRFDASLDRVALAITAGFYILMAAALALLLWSGARAAEAWLAAVLWPSAWLVAVTLIVVIVLSPRHYHLDDQRIAVARVARPVIISLDELESARAVQLGELGWVVRVGGSGGAGGYWGRFWSKKMGSMHWWLTRRDTAVLLRGRSGRLWLLSPDDRQSFLEVLRARGVAVS
jgi:hypothetical protein